jgi:hypothetical protein
MRDGSPETDGFELLVFTDLRGPALPFAQRSPALTEGPGAANRFLF